MRKLHIRCSSMLGTHHSWAITMRNLLEQFKSKGHELYLNSINGTAMIPTSWSDSLDRFHPQPDVDISYTLPRNFSSRFQKSSKLKLAIYNYETSKMPADWKSVVQYIDYVLPSSNFSKQVFLDCGWDEKKCVVVPHGINLQEFENKKEIDLGISDKFTFLNISIPHFRKNIDLLVDAYYSAFSEEDNVCLVIKTEILDPKKKKYVFECNVLDEISKIRKKHFGKKLPPIKICQNKFESMIPLYNSCDVLVSASSSEGFGLPLLEGLAADMIVIAPRCSGQLDFLNDHNSLLVGVKEINADDKYQYWRPTAGATTFLPLLDELSQSMLNAYNNSEKLKKEFNEERARVINSFSWESAASKILDLV